MMLDALSSALADLLTGWTPAYLLLGVLVGLVIGILPALGTTAGMALLVPFIYGMEPAPALAMLTGLLAVVATGDTVSSVLMGIPGASSSQATVLDGFPMAKRGEAARALSAAYFSSMVGGLFGAVVLTIAIVVARPIILAFGTGEMLMLVILGVTMVSILSGASLSKGFVAAGLGMTLGAIGSAPATGEYRIEFGIAYLSDGLPLTVVALAVFAIPEIVDLLRRAQPISSVPVLGRGWSRGILDTVKNWWLVLRCSAIGCLIGALPIGGSDWIAYGHAVQTSKDKEQFGKGDVRGVIAPEAANNAGAGGALVPTLIFGIPGSGSTAVFLGGLILLGIEPGPSMLDRNLAVTYTVIWSLALANIFGAGICFLISGQMARLTTVRFVYLAPFLLTIVLFGAFQSTSDWGDLVSLVFLGTFALFLRRFGFPRPAFLIGFVLQNNIEGLLYQTVQLYTLEGLAARPLMWILVAVNVASLWVGVVHRPKLQTEGQSFSLSRRDVLPQVAFLLLVVVALCFVGYKVAGLTTLGKVFPLVVAVLTTVSAGYGLWSLLKRVPDPALAFDSEHRWREREEGYHVGLYHYLAWILGFLAAAYLVGFLIGIVLFFVVFLRTKSDASWTKTAGMALSVLVALAALSHFFVLEFPRGILQDTVSLPWPFN